MEAAQRVFAEDLSEKAADMEKFINSSGDVFTEAEIKRLERFFHSINGTAATLGLEHLSSIGREWEGKLKAIDDPVYFLDKTVINGLKAAVKDIKTSIRNMYAQSATPDKPEKAEDGHYDTTCRGKILLIDDDISILKLLENVFTTEGYEVYICDDPAAAMDMISSTKPDIVLLDIMMPDISGFELLQNIRKKPEYSDIHVVILSARDDVDDKIQGIRSGADDYIVKPFIIGEVTTRVEMIMRRSANYREKLMKDILTGAYSRYYFNLRMSEEFERYKRYGSIFSIAFLDIDHYKYINDEFGHQAGDHILREFASHTAASMRKSDSIYRYGGEEFIILMPETTEESAYQVIERIRKEIDGKTLSAEGRSFNITFSAGIRQVKSGDENAVLMLLKERLAGIGYNVVTARDGRHAMALSSEIRPDVVIFDLTLPDIGRFEVYRRIKEGSVTNSAKVILLSKGRQEGYITEGCTAGIRCICHKTIFHGRIGGKNKEDT